MFKFKKNASSSSDNNGPSTQQPWFKKLGGGLSKTRKTLNSHLGNFFLGKKVIDESILEELETALLLTDVGIDTTDAVLQEIKDQLSRKALQDSEALFNALKTCLKARLTPLAQPLTLNQTPYSVLMVGINGAGKTTSIAKLAHYYQQQGNSVMLAAGDTFRAAAIEQLQSWGEANQAPVIAQHQGADSASVIFDAMASAQAKDINLLLADTAGRLHTQDHLMQELAKVKRVMSKQQPDAPHETLLVIDAGIGQNALMQCKQFHEAIGVTGLCITKLDGTAKGGILFALAEQCGIPIRFIGVGEGIDDLQPFDPDEFVDALFAKPE
ncbi:MAG TPA: signal recognition particle-docking protein FtsY [Coxiellaceae bacterium]|nr:signal recognition particle-docking protein FtsY [Coxiellaceae bacterium]